MPIQSVERAAAIIELVDAAPLGLTEIARAMDLPKPTVHGLVRTLVDVGFVQQDPDTGRYSVGDRLGRVGHGLDRHELRSLATNWSDRLAARLRLEVHLAVPDGFDALVLLDHVFRPDDSPQTLRIGEHQPVHATALGKVLLALAPGVGPVRALSLVAYTSASLVEAAALTAELGEVRRRGWAVEAGEHQPGIGGVAAPVRDVGGVVVAAVGVVGPQQQLLDTSHAPRPAVVQQVVAAGRAISQQLAHRW
ncbi:IclR family transcriptional regulator [Nocardioides mangrovicus]|uniref:Glycerol operon regulatory protein n=1 Tax=Nocardioides mangrovicus TaxID=2478913 RepID=A0A3L8P1E0_9ACTN|nr:IclR family transcriptional regulator [Nocardioides mangrovicus]RLV48851.1 IclR family transcriptional regulator [Nocardioides mangrovicus]